MQVDQIVVRKIVRLTRFLADFAKLVDRPDATGPPLSRRCKAFNISTGMRLLALSALLSFASSNAKSPPSVSATRSQPSSARGFGGGGMVPLGYVSDGRTLVVNPEVAETIRRIYDLYEAEPSSNALCHRAAALKAP